MLAYALQQHLQNHEVHTFNHEQLDIADRDQVLSTIMNLKPEVVINTAAYNAVDNAEDNQDLAFKVNAEGPQYLAEACSTNDAFLIHFSTDYVFDGTNADGYQENAAKNPLNVYGKSKSIGEDLIKENCSHYAIIRTSWLFGPNGNNFVTTMLGLAEKNKELNVVNDQRGCPTYTMDLAQALAEFIKHPQAGTFHLTNSTILTWFEFAQKIFRRAGIEIQLKPISSQELNRKAPRPQNSVLLNTKLKPLRDLDSALDDFLKNFLSIE